MAPDLTDLTDRSDVPDAFAAALGRGRVAVLAGPGVVDDGALDGLRALAAAHDLGVANTWGAKGVFAWDSPHHLGTCGLQARDFELLGFGALDTIVATGIDDDESPRDRFALAPVLDVAPRDLATLASVPVPARAADAPRPPLPNALYPRLAEVAQPGYVDAKVPLHPARAVADLGATLPAGGLVTAEPGVAGLWVARTFPTPALTPGEPRRVVVPGRRAPGAAIRLAAAAARAGRAAIAVTAGALDPAGRTELEHATAAGLDLVVVVWTGAGALRDADEHRERVATALATPGCTVVEIPVALGDTELLVAAAGPVVAWGGLA